MKDETVSKSEKNEYAINTREISIEGFLLKMPQATCLSDKHMQEELNELLINNVKEYFNNIGLSGGNINNFLYSIETQNDAILSILFTFDYYNSKAAHPLISAFAINIDLENMKIIELTKYKNRIEAFTKNNFSHVTKRKSSLKNDGGVLKDKNINELWKVMDDYSFYFKNHKIGIIFDVPYACGGYSIYEEK